MHRRSLLGGLAAGLIALAAVWVLPTHLSPSSRAIIAWDLGVVVFFGLLWRIVADQSPEAIRGWATKLRASREAVLVFALIAATAALMTVFVEMKLAKSDKGLAQSVRIALVIGTVALSWLFVQTMFALDYMHEFFAEDCDGEGDRGGLRFPGGQLPDFWDFLHFSVIIGAAAQTADIELTSKPMRRRVTVQSLIAFTYNAVILALTINLTAGLLG